MTRINTIDVTLLSDKHLLAEYRELPRAFDLVRKAQVRGESPNDKRNPKFYTMGKGHVRFFYNKLGWLLKRQEQLIEECKIRGFNVQFTSTDHLVEGIDKQWLGNWQASKVDFKVNTVRLYERDAKHYEALALQLGIEEVLNKVLPIKIIRQDRNTSTGKLGNDKVLGMFGNKSNALLILNSIIKQVINQLLQDGVLRDFRVINRGRYIVNSDHYIISSK